MTPKVGGVSRLPSRPALIGILDHPDPADRTVERRVRAALDAGLPVLLWRDRERADAEVEPLVRRLRAWTDDSGALLLVNRRPELTRRVGADGIHVGRDDPGLSELRERLHEGVIVGYAAHAAQEALEARAAGADYVTFSPIFDTPSKRGILKPVGVEALRDLCRRTDGVVALGGIDRSNLADVLAAGVSGVAAIRAVFGPQVESGSAVARLLEEIDRIRGTGLRPHP